MSATTSTNQDISLSGDTVNPMDEKKWDLKPENELRFEVEEGSILKVTLLEGTAEIFGVELAKQKEYCKTYFNTLLFINFLLSLLVMIINKYLNQNI